MSPTMNSQEHRTNSVHWTVTVSTLYMLRKLNERIHEIANSNLVSHSRRTGVDLEFDWLLHVVHGDVRSRSDDRIHDRGAKRMGPLDSSLAICGVLCRSWIWCPRQHRIAGKKELGRPDIRGIAGPRVDPNVVPDLDRRRTSSNGAREFDHAGDRDHLGHFSSMACRISQTKLLDWLEHPDRPAKSRATDPSNPTSSESAAQDESRPGLSDPRDARIPSIDF